MTELSAIQLAQQKRREMKDAGIEVVRLDPAQKLAKNPKSLRLAINAKCWDCSGGQRVEIRDCHIKTCGMWHVRPYQKDDAEDVEETE